MPFDYLDPSKWEFSVHCQYLVSISGSLLYRHFKLWYSFSCNFWSLNTQEKSTIGWSFFLLEIDFNLKTQSYRLLHFTHQKIRYRSVFATVSINQKCKYYLLFPKYQVSNLAFSKFMCFSHSLLQYWSRLWFFLKL